MKEVRIEILPQGLRFSRGEAVSNQHLLEILRRIAPEKEKELREFFEAAKEIDVLIGDRPMCG
jgi:hypothetical protein